MIRLNPALDVEALSREYALKGRLQIRDVLEPQSANEIHDVLASRTPWWTAFNEGDQVRQLSPEQAARLSPQQQQQMLLAIQRGAKAGYQYHYHFCPLHAEYFRAGAPRGPLFDFYEFLNSPAAMDFFRRLTGLPAMWADAQGTLYRSGNFLKSHSDADSPRNRLAAYVFNFTRDWERDWGGYLQFFNERHDIEEAYRPIFNAVNIFTVPMDHSVGIVAPFAKANRYSITGWLRPGPPPGPIGLQ